MKINLLPFNNVLEIPSSSWNRLGLMKYEKDLKLALHSSPLKKCSLLRWKHCCRMNYWSQFFTPPRIHVLCYVNLQSTPQTVDYSSLYFELGFFHITCFGQWQTSVWDTSRGFKCITMRGYFLLRLFNHLEKNHVFPGPLV